MSRCQPTANADLSGDPTGTLPTRRDFINEIVYRATGRYPFPSRRRNVSPGEPLARRIRRKIGYETDALHLKRDAPGGALTPNAEGDRFEFVTEQSRRDEFRRWLDRQIDQALLDPTTRAEVRNGSHWTAPYVRDGYIKGWQQGEGRLMEAGVSTEQTAGVQAILQLPAAEQQLAELYSRTFENLDGISEDMARQIRQELAQGLAEGVNPREMARRMADEIETVSNTRLKTLARTEVINSHSTATLDRFERAGQTLVVHGEWATAGDTRVCPICQALEGQVMTVQEMRAGTFRFDASGDNVSDALAGTYRRKPPAHPNGRCTIIPVSQSANAIVANSQLAASDGVHALAV
jgi:SPP1 gp7 family putative phage head morphogenesis protein